MENKKVLKTETELGEFLLKTPLEMSEELTNEIDNTTHNEVKDKSAVVLPKAPNRRTRRLLWKQDEKFRKRYKNELNFLEKYVEENGLESLSKYLEDKNKKEDGNKSI